MCLPGIHDGRHSTGSSNQPERDNRRDRGIHPVGIGILQFSASWPSAGGQAGMAPGMDCMVSSVPVSRRGRVDVVAGESDMMKNSTNHPCLAQLTTLDKQGKSLPIMRIDLPIRIGRAADCQMRLEEKGIWDHHVELDLDRDDCFLLRPTSEASTLVNDEPLKKRQNQHL